jgi:hypothetical protein
MSFYSSLVLAANEGVRPPKPGEVRELLAGLSLIDPQDPGADDFTVADSVGALFRDPAARAENDRFLFPSGIGMQAGVEVMTPDGTYEGPGWCVQVHGYGYFFPWELSDLRDRAIRSPILSGLRAAIASNFGGRFVFPAADEKVLRSRLIDGAGGWVWLASEDV